MSRFIRTANYYDLLNVDDVVEFTLSDGGGFFAHLRDGSRRKIGESEYTETKIEFATASIVPAAPDELLYRFRLGEERPCLVPAAENEPPPEWSSLLIHETERVIAWAIADNQQPTPITRTGAVAFGWNSGTQEIVATRHPDGRYDDVVNREFDDEEAVRQELLVRVKSLAAAAAAAD